MNGPPRRAAPHAADAKPFLREKTIALETRHSFMRSVRDAAWPIKLIALYFVILAVQACFAAAYKEAFVLTQALLCLFLPRWVAYILRMRLSVFIELSVAAIILGALVLGELMGFYDTHWWWDLPLHGFSGLLLAYVIHVMLTDIYGKDLQRRRTRAILIAAAIMASLGFSALWELYEFTADMLFQTNMQPSGTDTMIDLLVGFIGALVLIIVYWRR